MKIHFTDIYEYEGIKSLDSNEGKCPYFAPEGMCRIGSTSFAFDFLLVT